MSIKLDENLFNLKEEAELKGGAGSLPPGITIESNKQKLTDIKAELKKIDSNIDIDDKSLIQISKKKSNIPFSKSPDDTFNKFNKIFEKKNTRKSLQFLKASFFKTDESTIYTYSEHRSPIELVEDFSEYYDIIINEQRITYLKSIEEESVIDDFMKFINIIYHLCINNKTDDSCKNITEYLSLWNNMVKQGVKKGFILLSDENMKNLSEYKFSKLLLENNKFNPYEIFKLIEEMYVSLKPIIENFFMNDYYNHLDINNDNNIRFTQNIKDQYLNLNRYELSEIKIRDKNGNELPRTDYMDLYIKIGEKLKTFLISQELDTKISNEINIIQLLVNEIDELKNKTNIKFTSEKPESYDELFNLEKSIIEKKIEDYNKDNNIIAYKKNNASIVSSYNELKDKYDSATSKIEFKTDVDKIEQEIKDNKAILDSLDSKYKSIISYIKHINNKLKILKKDGKQFNLPISQHYEGIRDSHTSDKAKILTDDIPNNIAKWKKEIEDEEKKNKAEKQLSEELKGHENYPGRANDATNPEFGGGGKSNTKELRRKLNTMSIKQLKTLSTKNKIEYGNKNTIKSLINNYIKHITVN